MLVSFLFLFFCCSCFAQSAALILHWSLPLLALLVLLALFLHGHNVPMTTKERGLKYVGGEASVV